MNSSYFDIGIVGGGPAGLSAAITLGRAHRRVVLFDDGHPRNGPSRAVHCFLGSEGVAPTELRESGRADARHYGVELIDSEVTKIGCDKNARESHFTIHTCDQHFNTRAVLFATGVRDVLPAINGLKELYGSSVHHCPYCDAWEHNGERLAVIGKKPIELALTLKIWSKNVTVCTNGDELNETDAKVLFSHGLNHRTQTIARLVGAGRQLQQIEFVDGSSLACDALFFSSDQQQRSDLPRLLGCECDDAGHVKTDNSQCTSIEGVFLAGDADGEVQFAIAAAAEGAIAAVTIDKWLRKQDVGKYT
jgi:thioredoxin reductase